MNHFSQFKSLLLIIICSLVLSCHDSASVKYSSTSKVRDTAHIAGTVYHEADARYFKPPKVFRISDFFTLQGSVLWGATGRDDSGNIYFGLSTAFGEDNNAYLYQYKPLSDRMFAQGDVITQLAEHGLSYEGVSQNKIHSKIVQADDGFLYFSSFDEVGESSKTGALPKHGGHIWRKRPQDESWQHLLATDEPVIAINSSGRYVYGLAYWDHVIFQYDTSNGRFSRKTVGASLGHVSRNLLVAFNGDVFVPKVESISETEHRVSLEQFNAKLERVKSHPLSHYLASDDLDSHGIISYVNMANGNIYFMTAAGALYELSLDLDGQYQLNFIESINLVEGDNFYAPSMFTVDGRDFLVILGKHRSQPHYTWVIHQISSQTSVSYPMLELSSKQLLYGSVTRDDIGNMYVVGARNENRKSIATIYKLMFP